MLINGPYPSTSGALSSDMTFCCVCQRLISAHFLKLKQDSLLYYLSTSLNYFFLSEVEIRKSITVIL